MRNPPLAPPRRRVALRAMVLFTLVLGIGYTLLVTGIGQLVMPWQANGSVVRDSAGQTVGSTLIGQSFTDADGAPAGVLPVPAVRRRRRL